MNVLSTTKSLAICAVVAAFAPSTVTAQTIGSTNIEEDFSLFTSGSEESPSDAINGEDGSIPSSYFHTTGWTGYGVHQAGGACALVNPDNYGAQLNSVVGNYDGTFVVTVRAKTLSSNYNKNARLSIGLWEEAENQYNQTSYYENFVTTKDEWREFTYTFNNVDYAGSNRMFVCFHTDGKVLIDDVHISKSNVLQAPTLLKATDFKADGFTANWMPVENASHYLFSMFHNVKTPVAETKEFAESFASVKNGSMPEGWTFTSQSGSTPEFYSNESEKVESAIQFKTGDVIEMPDNGGTYTSLSFSLLEVKMPKNVEDLWGTEIFVDLWNGFTWTNFTIIQVDASEFGNQFKHSIDWSKFIKQDKYKCTKVRFRLTGLPDDCAFGLTGFKWSTKSSSTIVYDMRDVKVDDTSYTVDGLEPETDYFYTVKACNADATSESSTAIEADGLATPVAEAATDANHDSYTAHWQAVPKATGYSVDNFDVYIAPEDINSYTVISEDFSRIADTGVTIEKPFAFQNSSYQKLGDNMVQRDGWKCLWGGYADGCFVGTGMTDYNLSGELLTPELTLNNDEGRFHVSLKARSMLKDDALIVYNTGGGKSGRCDISPDEWRNFELNLDGGQVSDIVVFTTANHFPFIIDDIKITQNLKKGDKVFELLDTPSTVDADETECTVSNLSPLAANHTYAYGVTAVRQRQSSVTRSERSNLQVVDGNFTTVATPKAGTNTYETGRYTLEGMKTGKATRGVVIVRYSDGTVKKIVNTK